MDLGAVMQALYESEINCSVSSFWDDGFEVKLGDRLNGFVATGNFRSPEDCAEFLHTQARIHFPKSDYTFKNGGPLLKDEHMATSPASSVQAYGSACGQLNEIEGFSEVFAFTCRYCGGGVAVRTQ